MAVPDFYAICQSIWQELLYSAKSAAADDDIGTYDIYLTPDERLVDLYIMPEACMITCPKASPFV